MNSAFKQTNKNNIYQKRFAKLFSLMQENNISAIFIPPCGNMRYFSGITLMSDDRFNCLILTNKGEGHLVVSPLYEGEATKIKDQFAIYCYHSADDCQQYLKGIIPNEGDLLLDETMRAGHLLQLMALFGKDREYQIATPILSKLRLYKDEEESLLMHKAGEISAKAYEQILTQIKEGISELELASKLEQKMTELGGEGIAFDTIVCFGANCANPHHIPDQTKLKKGDCILMDFGCKVGGYCADISRSCHLGQPKQSYIDCYRAVKNALEAAKAVIRPGVLPQEIDEAARNVLQNAGIVDRFIHSIGHGLGLDVHEAPALPKNGQTPLEAGMAFTIEPGVYFPGEFGIRIEDAVIIHEDGHVSDLHILDKTLTILPI